MDKQSRCANANAKKKKSKSDNGAIKAHKEVLQVDKNWFMLNGFPTAGTGSTLDFLLCLPPPGTAHKHTHKRGK